MATVVQGNAEGVPLTLETTDSDKNDTKKRRFLWGLRRMFRRRSARNEQEVREPAETPGPPTTRTRTTNNQQQLTDDESPKRKRQQSGLSVSHDSVFTADASGADSDEERSRPRLRPTMAKGVPAELAAAVRRRARGDTSEEDEDLGLPRSPPASPPKRGLNRGRVSQTGAEQSSCSEGSLLSAGSSDPEDEFRSSRGDLVSSIPSALSSFITLPDSSDQDAEEPPSGLAPLSHSAARHKMAVRPRRTHGPPRRIKSTQLSPGTALPTTPEVNEEVARSTTPEVISSVYHNSSETTTVQTSRHIVTTTNSSRILLNDELHGNQVPKETRMKSSSLPPGLALNQLIGASSIKLSLSSNEELGHPVKVGRSKSNAQKKDSSDSDDNMLLNEQNVPYQYTKQNTSVYKSVENKFSNILVGELHRKFGSVSEDEELATSGNFETGHRYRKNGEKKVETFESISQSNESSKLKYEEVQEKQTTKKEESFFGRLLLRRSGKKTKKDSHNDKEEDEDDKKITTSYSTTNQKYVSEQNVIRQTKMSCSDQNAHKSIGQKVFSNQNHKRIDPRGGYANDPIVQESLHSKGSNAESTDKEKSDTQYSQTSLEENVRKLSSENSSKNNANSQSRLRQRVEPLDIPVSPELQRKPPVLPRTSLESKSFFPNINQGKVYPSKEGSRYIKNVNSPSKLFNPDEFQYPSSPKIKMSSDVLGFTNQNQSTGITTDLTTKPMSYSVSPPRSVWPHTYEISSEMKSISQGSLDHPSRNSKIDYESRFLDYSNQDGNDFDYEHSKAKPKIAGLSSYQQKISQMETNNTEVPFSDSLHPKTTVVKSQSFRMNSDSAASAMQQDMPSLPPIFGISESSIDSWESTYKKNLKETIDPPSSLEEAGDSLMSYTYKSNAATTTTLYTDRNIFIIPNVEKDSLPIDSVESSGQTSHYTKNIMRSKVRDTDISRIEANIDSIIGSPKPLNCVTLKSNSLDSVKSFSEKTEQNRKAISNESISQNKIYVNQSIIPDVVGSVSFTPKSTVSNSNTIENIQTTNEVSSESHVSVTVLNSTTDAIKTPDLNIALPEKTPAKSPIVQKETKSPDIKFSISSNAPVPEFMKIQLNRVDQKPASNVVLSTSTISIDNKSPKNSDFDRSISYDPKKSEKTMFTEVRKSESCDKNIMLESKDVLKPQRKFSSEDVEILEKSDVNNSTNLLLKKSLNRSTEVLTVENSIPMNKNNAENKPSAPTSLSIRKTSAPVCSLPPVSPTAHKAFVKKKSDASDTESLKRLSSYEPNSIDKSNAIKRVSSQELLAEQAMRTDRSSSSSDDANLDSAVIYRKKSMGSMNKNNKKDDEPELMKVFARRSLKLKDSESEALSQDILNITNVEESDDLKRNSKSFNIMTRSRDSDKENEADSPKDERKRSTTDTITELSQINNNKSIGKNFVEYRKLCTETVELMQAQRMPKKLLDTNPVSANNATNLQPTRNVSSFGSYQRSVSANIPLSQTTNLKIESKQEFANFKKDVSDLTPEKRLRNRTFPDSNNENGRDESNNKNNGKPDSTDTSSLPKRPWSQIKCDSDNKEPLKYRKSSFVSPTELKLQVASNNKMEKSVGDMKEKENDKSLGEIISTEVENGTTDNVTDGSPQFKGILQMKAEWERRAQQAMTK
ncbi:uncharacterized protein LOC143920389 [Arctopsyche grandis]|uniref:uncharacterized protein LOC143920389 n=1 Tax=Arctopsyche grandis TaxID=121162 RepID=UPI00406D889B